MVQNVISFGEREDRVLNIVRAKFGLKNKSEAVALVTQTYEENFLEPELRPEFVESVKAIRKGKYAKFTSADELRKLTS
jgi:hypothetical protein